MSLKWSLVAVVVGAVALGACAGSDGTVVLPASTGTVTQGTTAPSATAPGTAGTDTTLSGAKPQEKPGALTVAPTNTAPKTTATTKPATTSAPPSGASPAERVGGLGVIPNAPCPKAVAGEPPRVVVFGATNSGEVPTASAGIALGTVRLCFVGFRGNGPLTVIVRDAGGVERFRDAVEIGVGATIWYPGIEAPLGAYTMRVEQPGQAPVAGALRLTLPLAPVLVLSTGGDGPVSARKGDAIALHLHGPAGARVLVVLGGPLPTASDSDGPIVARTDATLTGGRVGVTVRVPANAASGRWCVALAGAEKVARCVITIKVA